MHCQRIDADFPDGRQVESDVVINELSQVRKTCRNVRIVVGLHDLKVRDRLRADGDRRTTIVCCWPPCLCNYLVLRTACFHLGNPGGRSLCRHSWFKQGSGQAVRPGLKRQAEVRRLDSREPQQMRSADGIGLR